MADYSDNPSNRINLLEFLEGTTFDTDVNRSLIENTYNRFLTKDDTIEAIGTIGQRDPALKDDRQLKEDTIHRQTYQLQPIAHHKVATEHYALSFKDFVNRLALVGVDPNRLDKWGSTEQFNYIPPVDLDKLINYRDYYWYDETGVAVVPQYITMGTPCTPANSRLAQRQRDIAGIGAQLPIVATDPRNRVFIIQNDMTTLFGEGVMFEVYGNEVITGSYTVARSHYDAGKTIIEVNESFQSTLFQGSYISFDSQIQALTGQRNEACDGSAGWDAGAWDSGEFADGTLDDAPVLLQYVRDNLPDSFDLIIRAHPEYLDGAGAIVEQGANPMWVWMDLDPPEFTHTWDSTSTALSRTPWQLDNKWLHKLDLPSGAMSTAIRATAPILEYRANIQLNEWSVVHHKWYTRSSTSSAFELTTQQPTAAECASATFTDLWAYAGSEPAVPADWQAINTSATAITPDTAGTSTFMAHYATVVDGDGITIPGEHTLSAGTTITLANGSSLTQYTVESTAIVAGNTTVVLDGQFDDFAAGHLVLVPNDTVYNAVIIPASARTSTLADSNMVRVYLSGTQLPGNFDEITYVHSDGNPYVCGVLLNAATTKASQLQIGIRPAAAEDEGKAVIEVRTAEYLKDDQYEDAGRPVVTICGVSYFRMVQSKAISEQKIPQFDMFHPSGEHANRVSPIFFYEIDPTAKVHSHVGMRLRTETTSDEVFYFIQHLIDEDDGATLCYKERGSETANNPQGLFTIWRASDGYKYTPRFVDVDRRADGDVYYDNKGAQQVASVDASNGDWEVLDQITKNASHANRRRVNTTELREHIVTILRKQTTPDGFIPSVYGFRLLDELNFSVGGTIKEHNGSADLLISSLIASNASPLDVIRYAATAYETSLASQEDFVLTNMVQALCNTDRTYLTNLPDVLVSSAIATYEQNDDRDVIFGDSTSYTETGKGIRNWPATLPMLGLARTVRPYRIKDVTLGIDEVVHHDGHIASYPIANSDIASIAYRTLKYRMSSDRLRGWSPSQSADGGSTFSSYLDIPWDRLAPGDVWVNGSMFKRFQVVAVTSTQPPIDVPHGTIWIREPDGKVMVRDIQSSSPWVESEHAAGDVTVAWVDVDVQDILTRIILEIETRLYESAFEQSVPYIVPESLYVRDSEDSTLLGQLNLASFNDFASDRLILDPLASVYNSTDPFTWNYKNVNTSSTATDGSLDNVWAPILGSNTVPWATTWQAIYLSIYGTPYPHREPWVLQGYTQKPLWWDDLYADDTGDRVWKRAMWTNVLQNVVPAEHDAPTPIVGTVTDVNSGMVYSQLARKFSFVPVNIDREITNSRGETIYRPDDLFPPYDSRLFLAANSDIVSAASEGKPLIKQPAAVVGIGAQAPYEFGDMSPIEWRWLKSVDLKYDLIENIFMMQPINFFNVAWGTPRVKVGGLELNAETSKVLRHQDVVFHGDVVDGQIYQSRGLNQWYVNYHRSAGLDFKVSSFRELWTKWEAKLAYQIGCYINPKSFNATSPGYDLIKDDYELIPKRSPAFDTRNAAALMVTVSKYGSSRIRGGLKIPTGRGEDWEFLVDVPLNEQTATLNYYGVSKYEYEVVDVATGLLELKSGTLPWADGDRVYIETTQFAPYPMDPTWAYYVSRVEGSATQFRLLRNRQDAVNHVPVVLRTEGTGTQVVGQAASTFSTSTTYSGAIEWRHHGVNTSTLHSISTPFVVTGVQGLIDFIDGYAVALERQGIIINHSSAREVTSAGRLVSWQTETEDAISAIYQGVGRSNTAIRNRGASSRFIHAAPEDDVGLLSVVIGPDRNVVPHSFVDAQEVYLFATDSLPGGLMTNVPYYVIVESETTFRLASTGPNAFDGIAIPVSGTTVGAGHIGVFPPSTTTSREVVEINPFKMNIWVSTPIGAISDISSRGNGEPIKVYDQAGIPIAPTSLLVLRHDKLTRINNRGAAAGTHIGGIRLTLDGHEHAVIFNGYTTDGYLIYDPFIGLHVARMSVRFNRSLTRNLRPSVGGYFATREGDLLRNLEASVDDMRHYYDAHSPAASSSYISRARDLLGYEDPQYLNQVNADDRSKFLFWQGMIHNKGSAGTLTPFINSARFVDAKMDEFWAHKLADFGDIRQKYKPEMYVYVDDVTSGDLRYEFDQPQSTNSSQFVHIGYSSDSRWINSLEVSQQMDNQAIHFNALKYVSEVSPIVINSEPHIVLSDRLDGISVEYQYNDAWIVLTASNGGLIPINDRAFRLNTATVPTTVYIVGYRPDVKCLDPVDIVDAQTGVAVAALKTWDPLNGHHSYTALQSINYQRATDPASYDGGSGWTFERLGDRWLDTSTVGYVPYDDHTIYPELTDRLSRWGRLQDWSSPIVYEWVSSSSHPSEYEALAVTDEGNATKDETERASGRPKTSWVRIATGEMVDLTPINSTINTELVIQTLMSDPAFEGLDVVVYRNGEFESYIPVAELTTEDVVAGIDYITFVPVIPRDSEDFEEQYQFIELSGVDDVGSTAPTYFFWVSGRNVATNSTIGSAAQAASGIAFSSMPYHVYSNFVEAGDGYSARYTQIVIRGAAHLINDDARYVIRMSRDFTLRDELNNGASALDLKNKHSEWKLFRQHQPYKVSRQLWDVMAEALIGYKLDRFDEGIRSPVPSLTHALHDAKFGTTTRFGMGPGQAFVDRDLGLATVKATIQTPEFSTQPIDKYVFLDTHTFDTPVNIKQTLDYIFDNFSDTSVNQIFFEVMRDALAVQQEFKGLFMTSFVALHGIKVLETAGTVIS